MPQLRNAKKALRQSEKRALRNQNVTTNIKYLEKQFKKQATAKDAKSADTMKNLIKAIDKASQKGILKKNTAARKKSRLSSFLKRSA